MESEHFFSIESLIYGIADNAEGPLFKRTLHPSSLDTMVVYDEGKDKQYILHGSVSINHLEYGISFLKIMENEIKKRKQYEDANDDDNEETDDRWLNII